MSNFDPNERIELRDGDIVLWHRTDRGDPRIWQATYKLPDGSGKKRMSTKKRDRTDAIETALATYDEFKLRNRFGLSLESRSFETVANQYLAALKLRVKQGEASASNLKDHTRMVERYLIPFFGRKMIDEIKNADIAKFIDWRKAYWTTGPGSELDKLEYKRGNKIIKAPVRRPKELVPERLHLEFIVLRQVYAEALKQGVVKEVQLPTLKEPRRTRAKQRDNRRPAFTIDDWWKIQKHRREFIAGGKNEQSRARRQLLYYFMHFLIASGIRPGTESDNIRWKQISALEIRDKTYYQIYIPAEFTKQKKARKVLAEPRIKNPLWWLAMKRYVAINGEPQPRIGHGIDFIEWMIKERGDEKLFCLPNGKFQSEDSLRAQFDTLMRNLKLKHEETGKDYVFYSCRHTYATSRLRAGTGIYVLATNMGTSVQMIEKHYGQVATADMAEELTRRR